VTGPLAAIRVCISANTILLLDDQTTPPSRSVRPIDVSGRGSSGHEFGEVVDAGSALICCNTLAAIFGPLRKPSLERTPDVAVKSTVNRIAVRPSRQP